MSEVGLVLSIERGSLHDGPGIRTTVFLKGCPLSCSWCHNPESQAARPELAHLHETCTSCGSCVEACPHGCHSIVDSLHQLDRSSCTACGSCVDACPHGALEVKGRRMTVAEVMAVVVRDRAYYESSGGGLTISGGEPTAQPGFCRALLAAARAAGIRTCLETSACAAPAILRDLALLVDLFLIDCKESDPERHLRFTGVALERVRAGTRALAEAGAAIRLRCPIVPGLNDREDHLAGIAAFAASLPGVQGIEVMPYHPLGASKARSVGRDYPLPDLPFSEPEQAENWRQRIAAHGPIAVDRS